MEVPSNVPGHGIRTGMAMLLISKPHGKFPKLALPSAMMWGMWWQKKKRQMTVWFWSRLHGGSNISCSLDSEGQSITCLDQDYCAYSEEVDRINLTIYFRSSFVVETYNKKFYIMDIGERLKIDKMGLRILK